VGIRSVCLLFIAVPNTKLFAWGEGESGGHVLRETTSRGLRGLVCRSRTSERGKEGDCVKEGGGGEGERAQGLLESVLFIGTQFSILYTFMYSPA
jgi:hypothetical protein